MGAIGLDLYRAWFSTYGEAGACDVAAPGHRTVATFPTWRPNYDAGIPIGYRAMTGTSMSAPHVAGAAALLLAAKPSLTPPQVKEALMNTCVKLRPDEPRWNACNGVINVPAALQYAKTHF